MKVAILRPRLAFKCVESGALGGCAVAELSQLNFRRTAVLGESLLTNSFTQPEVPGQQRASRSFCCKTLKIAKLSAFTLVD